MHGGSPPMVGVVYGRPGGGGGSLFRLRLPGTDKRGIGGGLLDGFLVSSAQGRFLLVAHGHQEVPLGPLPGGEVLLAGQRRYAGRHFMVGRSLILGGLSKGRGTA